ncbi:MAG: hypothetical protein V3S66_02595 [Desulfobacterales bacterium]
MKKEAQKRIARNTQKVQNVSNPDPGFSMLDFGYKILDTAGRRPGLFTNPVSKTSILPINLGSNLGSLLVECQ